MASTHPTQEELNKLEVVSFTPVIPIWSKTLPIWMQVELKSQLKKFGLTTKGRKGSLVKRLYDALKEQAKTMLFETEIEPEPDGKSGNTKLCTQCSYCDFKKICWPHMRTFIYKGGPRYLINVAREPRGGIRGPRELVLLGSPSCEREVSLRPEDIL